MERKGTLYLNTILYLYLVSGDRRLTTRIRSVAQPKRQFKGK
jgi:hypothetical protein